MNESVGEKKKERLQKSRLSCTPFDIVPCNIPVKPVIGVSYSLLVSLS